MPRNLDPKMLERFAQTVQISLPKICSSIESYLQDDTQREALEDAYQDMHPIKDAAEMLEFLALSQIASYVEEMIEDIATGRSPTETRQRSYLLDTATSMQRYIESLVAADGQESVIMATAVKAFRRFKDLPEDGDEAAVQELLGGQTGMSEARETASLAEGDLSRDDTDPGVDHRLENVVGPGSIGQFDFSAEMLEGFLLEAAEHLDTIGRLLPELSQEPEKRESLQQVRRSVHTLKGAAGIVGFPSVSHLAHRMEDVLDELYDGHRSFTSQTSDLLFATFDVLDNFLRDNAAQGDLSQAAQPLYSAYDQLLEATTIESPPVPIAASLTAESEPLAAEHTDAADNAAVAQQTLPARDTAAAAAPPSSEVIRVPLDRLDSLVRLVSELVISRSVYEQYLGRLSRQVEELELSIDRLRRVTTSVETQFEVSVLTAGRGELTLQPAMPSSNLRSRDHTLIQDFDELEFDRYSAFHLISGELTETTADIGALGQEFHDMLGDFDSYLTRHSRLTSEIQDKLMQLRMVPLTTMATRLHRAVRVTANQLGKNVAFVLAGEEVEFDKTMLEEMADPLLHLLRNAVDHGIESPERRRELGKSPQGRIDLRAFREGTQIVLQIRDDGAGIDPERLRSVAVQGGFVPEAEAVQMTDEELYQLIFIPGFTMAKEVSEVSGRGVGMDVVHTTVSQLKGRIVLDSIPGQGSTFTIRLPLTLAIARVLLVKAYGETFAIPLADVSQILRIEPHDIDHVGDRPVIRCNGEVFPLLHLGALLNLQQPSDTTSQHLLIVIAQAGDKHVALVVDQFLGGREVVVKTLGNHLRHVQGIIGSTLMGDGSIVLILNPAELIVNRQPTVIPRPIPRHTATTRASDAYEILIVDDSYSVRRVVSNLIKSVGWRPTLAKDGLEALDILQRAIELPDLILLDIEMPQMDGYELTSILRSNTLFSHIPIVVLTSRSGAKHRQKAFEVGVTEYFVKPYRDETLVEAVRQLVSRSRGSTAA